MRLALTLLLLPAAVLADGFMLLADDTRLSKAEVQEMTEKPVVEFYEGGQSRYGADGSYSYTYQGGGTAHGQFEIASDGVICILYNNGRGRCDTFVWSHDRLVMLTEKGERFPIRP